MKKYLWIILLIIVLVVSGIIYFYSNKANSNYSAKRTGIENNTSYQNFSNNFNTSSNTSNNESSNKIIEQEIATFSTVIKNKRDSNRQGNISITCSALNNTVVNPGETFSFCAIIGPSTIEKGYREANVIIQGTETKGLGGGNCQVSSTLYNAVLAAPNKLEIVERHPHSAPVPYIEEGKDAAVSYGTHDFKFKNNTDSKVKIIAENTTDSITIKLIEIS